MTRNGDNLPFVVQSDQGSEIVGEILTWDVGNVRVMFDEVQAKLEACGFNASVARKICPSNGFRRAARQMEHGRIIRQLGEVDGKIRFQFTGEERDDTGGRFDYRLQAIVELDRETGEITCKGHPEIESAARVAVDTAIRTRTGRDISAIVSKLFDDPANPDLDLIPLRDRGGVYFVRAERIEFVDRAERFLVAMGCRMNRFPVARGNNAGGVKEAVTYKMDTLLSELHELIMSFGEDTRESTFGKTANRIVVLRAKIESYASYLGDEQARLIGDVALAEKELNRRISELVVSSSVPGAQEISPESDEFDD